MVTFLREWEILMASWKIIVRIYFNFGDALHVSFIRCPCYIPAPVTFTYTSVLLLAARGSQETAGRRSAPFVPRVRLIFSSLLSPVFVYSRLLNIQFNYEQKYEIYPEKTVEITQSKKLWWVVCFLKIQIARNGGNNSVPRYHILFPIEWTRQWTFCHFDYIPFYLRL